MSENVFEKAASEVKTEEVNSKNIESVDTETNKVEAQPSIETEIDLTSIKSEKWIHTPKEIGEQFEKPYKIVKFIKKPGKMVQVEGKRPFWSGLQTFDENGAVKEKLEEHIIVLNDGVEDCNFKLPSWETYYKFITFVKFCNSQGLQAYGFDMLVKRTGKGSDTAGKNFEFTFSRGESKFLVTGKTNEIKKL